MNWIETYHRLPTKKESKLKMLILQVGSTSSFITAAAIYDFKKKKFVYDYKHPNREINEKDQTIRNVVAFLPLKKYNVDWLPIRFLEYELNKLINVADCEFFIKYNIGRKQVYKVLWFNKRLNKLSYPGYDIAYKNEDKVKFFLPIPNYKLISHEKLCDRIQNKISKDLKIIRFKFAKACTLTSKEGMKYIYEIEVLVEKIGKNPRGDFYRNTQFINFRLEPYSDKEVYESIYFNFLRHYKILKETDPEFFKKNNVSKFKKNTNNKPNVCNH